MLPTKGYATHAAHEPLKPFSFERRELAATDVQIEILFCGVCHSDLHIVRNEWGGTIYPMRSRSRNCRTHCESRTRRAQIQGRRFGRGRVPGRLRSRLRK